MTEHHDQQGASDRAEDRSAVRIDGDDDPSADRLLEATMWRFREHMPVHDTQHIVTLGEGQTPLLPVTGTSLTTHSIGSIHLKAEHHNPTGSFKDRIASVAASLIREGGLGGAVGTSSGNGGAAMAAYGARAGVPVVLFTVSGIVDGKLQQILAQGASTNIVGTLGREGATGGSVAPTILDAAQQQRWLAFLTGARFAPEAMRGAETIAYELAEQHPSADRVYVPVGGGGLLGSIWRGYRRLVGTCPRLIGVQPSGCPTLARALAGDRTPLKEPLTTTISGLQVSMLFDYGAIDAIAETGGHLVEIADEEAWDAQRLLAREEGVFVEPAGATALAGLQSDLRTRSVGAGERVVVITSGAGHKDAAAVSRLAADNPARKVAGSDIPQILSTIADRRWHR